MGTVNTKVRTAVRVFLPRDAAQDVRLSVTHRYCIEMGKHIKLFTDG